MNFIGEIAALGAALSWAMAGLLTEKTSRKMDSTELNLVVKVLGYFMIAVVAAAAGGNVIPRGVPATAWFWLTLSGIVGFALGDIFLFRAYHLLGTTVALLIFSVNPVITAVLGFFIFGETLTLFNIIGMALVLVGIALVIIEGTGGRFSFRFTSAGLAAAFLAALGQSLANLLSKQGMAGGVDVFTTTQVRLLAAIPVIWLIVRSSRRPGTLGALRNRTILGETTLNTFLGTVVGVSLSMTAIVHTKIAIASTLMSVSPIIVIPITVLFLKRRLDLRELLGALICVTGIAVLFIR